MAHDEISFIVRQDPLIITLGKRMFAVSGREAHEHQYREAENEGAGTTSSASLKARQISPYSTREH